MAFRIWSKGYPRVTMVFRWDVFFDALFDEHPYPEYYQCILCSKNASLVEVDCGAWPDGEQAGHAIPSSETRSWGLLFRDQISYLVGLHCFCRGCLIEVVQKRELPLDPDDLRHHGLLGEEPR